MEIINPLDKKGPRVLFVCTANICRSPMAQAFFKTHLQKKRPNDWQEWGIDSAGTWAVDGKEASKFSQKVMAQRGINIANHSSKVVSADFLKEFDLILTMEAGHKEALQFEFPAIGDRVYMLSEMIGKEEPVADPYGGQEKNYESTAQLLDQIIARGMDQITLLAWLNWEKRTGKSKS